jgi:hypothetical protein
VAPSTTDRALIRRRQDSRVALLKRRATLASLLGFVAFFGLAAQHAVRGASARRSAASSGHTAAAARPTTFFDESASGFSFDEEDSGTPQSFSQSQPSAPPPVAQTSVS